MCQYILLWNVELVIQSNEVGGSYHMHGERRTYRVMQFLQQQDLTIEVLVTDRHRQIAKWLCESYPEITHYYDVWHLAKGMKHSVF